MKSSLERGVRASWPARCCLTASSSMLPCSGFGLQSPRYSRRIQRSTRLAVAARDSPSSDDTSAHSGLRASVIGLLSDDADDLSALDRIGRRDRQIGDRPIAMRADLVLHLHRLDDAENLSGG